MDWKGPAEQAGLGFLGYGSLALLLSGHFGVSLAAAFAGALIGAAYQILRPFPWKRYMNRKKRACVSVDKSLRFVEVSKRPPAYGAYIGIAKMDKAELYEKLSGKRLNLDEIPFHMRVILEEGRELELPWETLEPLLRDA